MIALLFLLLASVGLGAQGAGVEPQEPEIVLPDVILRVDDLSVEKVEAVLPGEEELLSPERQIPLPQAEELAIREPELPAGVGEPADTTAGAPAASLAAQVVLGAGSMNHLYSLVSLNRVGGEPRFKLRFLHEMLDGIGGAAPGSGYSQRDDSLEAGLEASLGELDLKMEGSLEDRERGLQDQGGALYGAKIGREGVASLELEHPLGERLAFGTRLEGSFATELLTGVNPADTTGVLLKPALWGEYHSGPLRLVLQTRYAYQSPLEDAAASPELQRFGADLRFSLDLQERYLLEARAGWLWNSQIGHLFPFSVAFSGNPAAFLSFQFSGGYRVQEVSYLDVLTPYPLVRLAGASLEDNHGWFVDAGMGLSLKRSLSLQGRALLAWNSGLLLPQVTRDSDNVLFTIASQSGTQISTDVRLRWNLGSAASLSFAVQSELDQRSDFTPLHAALVELEGTNRGGRWGGRASVGFDIGWIRPAADVSEMPTLDLSGFYNISDAVRLVAEVEDILDLINQEPRYYQNSWAPFEAPGFRGTVKVQINL
jgi:hypothetical protein